MTEEQYLDLWTHKWFEHFESRSVFVWDVTRLLEQIGVLEPSDGNSHGRWWRFTPKGKALLKPAVHEMFLNSWRGAWPQASREAPAAEGQPLPRRQEPPGAAGRQPEGEGAGLVVGADRQQALDAAAGLSVAFDQVDELEARALGAVPPCGHCSLTAQPGSATIGEAVALARDRARGPRQHR